MGYSGDAVKLCGCTLHAAADDLGLPALFFLFFRTILICINIFWLGFSFYDIAEGCNELNLVHLYYALTLASTITINVAYILVYNKASAGSIFQYEKRNGIEKYLYLLIILYLVEIGINGFGIYVAVIWVALFQEVNNNPGAYSPGCADIDVLLKLALIIFWIIWIFLDIAWYLWFSFLLVSRRSRRKKTLRLDEFERLQWEWEQRCRTWCCWGKFLSCGMLGSLDGEYSDHAFDQVAEIFGSWFYGHNMSVVELITAIFLLRVEQRKRNEDRLLEMWDGESFQIQIKDGKTIPRASQKNDLESRDAGSRISEKLHEFLWGESKQREDSVGLSTSDGPTQILPNPGKRVILPKFQTKPGARPLDMSANSQDRKDLQFITDYLPYMLAIYGWKLLVYMNTIELRPWRNLTRLLKLPRKRAGYKFISEDDNACQCASSALLTQARIKDQDVVYASFSVIEAMSIPHAVIVDHDRLSIVVTCRGSLSLPDLLTDAMIEPESLIRAGERWGFDGHGHYAHHGMLLIAENIRIQFQKTGILHKLLGMEKKHPVPTNLTAKELSINVEESINSKLSELPDCTGYDLIVIGHSLGAGVAAILSLMLKDEFPGLRCVAYSAPGCVFDRELCKEVSDWTLCPFIGHDLVPHLSWHSLKKLRGQLLEVLRRSKANKNEIFRKAAITFRSGNKLAAKLLYPEGDVPNSEARMELLALIESLADKDPARKLDQIRMGTPGKLMHFPKTSSAYKSLCRRNRTYEATWVDVEDMDSIAISTRMVLDHFPNFGAFIIHRTNTVLQYETRKEFLPSIVTSSEQVEL